jgi:hypothetical protein
MNDVVLCDHRIPTLVLVMFWGCSLHLVYNLFACINISLFVIMLAWRYDNHNMLLLVRFLVTCCCCCLVQARSAVVSTVYRKAFRLSNKARQGSTVGEVVNLQSIDAQKLQVQ